MEKEIISKKEKEKKYRIRNQFVSLATYYSNELKWIERPELLDDIFSDDNALTFIKQTFEAEIENDKIKACLDMITPFRAKHTVSSYLLGLAVKDQLRIDTRKWRCLPGERSPRGSFLLFWSWVCLFHDIGYIYENNSCDYLECESVYELTKKLHVSRSLILDSDNAELISNYYEKRVKKDKQLDHGIVGAILLYDALFDLASNYEKYSKIREYPEFFVKICDAIALHNMWRATKKTEGDYIYYKLYELIPKDDNSHKIYLKDNALLFILGMVDTIELLKAFSNEEKDLYPPSPMEVFNDAEIKFLYYGSNKELGIDYRKNFGFYDYIKKITDKNEGIEAWMGVWTIFNEVLSIELDTKSSSKKQEKGL